MMGEMWLGKNDEETGAEAADRDTVLALLDASHLYLCAEVVHSFEQV